MQIAECLNGIVRHFNTFIYCHMALKCLSFSVVTVILQFLLFIQSCSYILHLFSSSAQHNRSSSTAWRETGRFGS
jgi:hypothetical protein